mmetsp:Transcript_151948/g.487716  ORF Transcript_151948/g.487716 Transcript_151948/m.487716 type:complete len:205 (-) Transcript_151948:124-738(-)
MRLMKLPRTLPSVPRVPLTAWVLLKMALEWQALVCQVGLGCPRGGAKNPTGRWPRRLLKSSSGCRSTRWPSSWRTDRTFQSSLFAPSPRPSLAGCRSKSAMMFASGRFMATGSMCSTGGTPSIGMVGGRAGVRGSASSSWPPLRSSCPRRTRTEAGSWPWKSGTRPFWWMSTPTSVRDGPSATAGVPRAAADCSLCGARKRRCW